MGYKTRVKNEVKEVRVLAGEDSAEKAQESLKNAISILQKTASKGVIHRKNASRKISRLTHLVNRTSAL